MRVPLSWLRELTPVTADAETVATRLHEVGLLLEEIDRPKPLANVVVGEVLACSEIEGAAAVQLVEVADGNGSRAVVCGAFNFGPGDKVPLALPGAVLPDGMEIAERYIKALDVTSHGMLCAEDELGVGEDHSGILVLDTEAPAGAEISAVLGLDETVIELEVTPNRPDCLGMVGVAREVAAMFGTPLHVPQPSVQAEAPEASKIASVRVDTPEGCPRYAATVIEGVEIGASPGWLAGRLRTNGIRPINNVVDITNYVMLETGQPIHAFDLDRLEGPVIVVRDAEDGEIVQTLDGIDRTMRARDVLICDADRPVAIGGVMGGGNSEVSTSTRRILIEAAHFDPARIMRTAKRLGLRTDASARFERGVDPAMPPHAALRAAGLIVEVAGGVVRTGVIDVKAAEPGVRRLELRAGRVNAILGTDLAAVEIAGLLGRIGINLGGEAVHAGEVAGAAEFDVPTWRPDLEREIDLIEEVARLYGYNRIERTLPAGSERIGGLTREQLAVRRIRGLLLAAGLHEAQTTSFVSDAVYGKLGWAPGERVRMANPLREEDRYLRTSLVPTLLGATAYNAARNAQCIRLAEIGKVYYPPPEGDVLPVEEERIGVVLSGVDEDSRAHYGGRARLFDVYDVKGVLEVLFEGLGLAFDVDPEAVPAPGLHPGRSAAVGLAGEVVGWFGELHPRVADAWDVAASTELAELELVPLVAAYLSRSEDYEHIPAFPPTYFDTAFIVDEDVACGALERVLLDAGGNLLAGVALFDVYRGEGIPAGKKSLAFELTFQSPERTLTDDDVRRQVDAMVSAAGATLGAELRS